MNDGNPTPIEGEPEAAPLKRTYDFSILQGLQVVGVEPAREDAGEEAGWAEALRLELEARAARFRQAVDNSIVLANDGVIRWLGDPVAKLARGPDLLGPGAVILADSRLPESARETVAARLELWLAALTRRLLGPLFALMDLQNEAEAVRDLGAKLVKALGVLERDRVRGQVKGLDQYARAALRKHGVRFGAHYIYVPTSLKPAARALALQLWGLERTEADADALRETLLPLAASGRTSLPVDMRISRDGYRVAGFRACGERAVRVDILERLADLIRAAFVSPNAGQAPRTPSGFSVSGQMTSLAGCSGESFFSILRSLGFESFAVKRSEVPVPVAPTSEAPNAAPPQSADALAAEGPAEDAPETRAAPLDSEAAAPEEVGDRAPPELASEASPEAPADSESAARAETGDLSPPGYRPEAEPEGPVEPQATLENAPPAPAEAKASAASYGETPDGVQTPAAEAINGSKAGSEEIVILWRPARRPRHEAEWRRGRDRGELRKAEGRQPAAPVDETAAASHLPSRSQAPGKSRRFARASADSQERGGRRQGRQESDQAEEKAHDSVRPRATPRGEQAQSSPPRAVVDPNSPFAKLLELRPLLEKQAKNRS
jgi:ATP-dependent RNA helicase SUPV3L1/SUV3